MSDSPLNFLQASVRANELVANNRLGIGTHTQTAPLHVKAAAAEIRLEDGENNGQVTETALKISTDGGVTSFQSGTSFTDGTTGEFKFQNMGATNTYMTVNTDEVAIKGGSLELTQVSNVAQIKSSSNVVAEFNRSKKLIKYPRVAMTAATTSGYTVSATSVLSNDYTNYAPWKAFDNMIDGNVGWAAGNLYSASSPGEATSSATLFNNRRGEYIDLQLPDAIKVSHFIIKTRESGTYIPEDSPGEGYLYGSNDGSNWTELKFFSGLTYGGMGTNGNTYEEIQVDATGFYSYLRLQVTKRSGQNSTDTFMAIGELEYYGIPEYDPEAHGTDVVVRSVPNVPNTDWLEVYYDGQDYTSMPSSVTDKSGNGVTGTPNGGVGFDTEYKAFTFDGVDDVITGTHGLGTGSIGAHSMSYWLKRTSQVDSYDYHFMIGSGGNTGGQTSVGINENKILIAHNGGTVTSTNTVITDNTWIHVAVNYNGGTTNLPANHNLYINGIEQSLIGSGTGSAFSLVGNELSLGRFTGGTNGINGSIANFRLFKRVLTADEVWQLYAYQKEYFNVSPDVVTFKGGRLGIGTSEPRAVLDVRGTIMCDGYILQKNVVCCRWINGGDKTVSNTEKIPFDGIVYDPNNLWSTSSDAFVAPVTGVYLVHVNLATDSTTSYDGNHELYLNDSPSTPRLRGFAVSTGVVGVRNANSHHMVSLQAGDEMSVRAINDAIFYGSSTYAHSHVSIHLISDV